jgi:hypothetical protein
MICHPKKIESPILPLLGQRVGHQVRREDQNSSSVWPKGECLKASICREKGRMTEGRQASMQWGAKERRLSWKCGQCKIGDPPPKIEREILPHMYPGSHGPQSPQGGFQ